MTVVSRNGIVYLIGAGPGDPELITVKGARLIATADALVHDRLVHPEVLALNVAAERHDVGKRDGSATSPTQEQINELLISLARQGKRVARVKGGDPFVFGRGGEEALALRAANVRFETVAGVTAGTAVPASAGIPVTHRGISTSVTFVTANADPARTNAPVDWKAIAAVKGTIVIFMGARTIASVVDALLAHGADPDLPAAAIEWGTYGPSRQRDVAGSLRDLPELIAAHQLAAPLTIVIGNVVRLQDQIRESIAASGSPLRQGTAVLLIDHGSRLAESNALLHRVARLTERDDLIAEPAHMELASPTIAEGFANCVARGASRVIAVPYMLSPGRHSTQDVPRLVRDAAAPFPDVRFGIAEPLGLDQRIASVVVERAMSAAAAVGS